MKHFSKMSISIILVVVLLMIAMYVKMHYREAYYEEQLSNKAILANPNNLATKMEEKASDHTEKGHNEKAHAKKGEQLLEVADSVYSYTVDGHYFSMFMVTSEGVIAIEPINPKHSAGLLKAIKSVTDQPVKYLLYSHNHWDHSGGGQVFKDAGATGVAHIRAYEWMEANPHKNMVLPDESWSGARKDIILGGKTVELHYLGMNHGLGMTVFVLPDTKTAYIADLVTPNRVLMSIVPDFNIKEWERSLNEILDLDFDKAIYSHHQGENAIAGGDKEDVRKTLQFIADIRSAIFAEFKKGTPSMMVPDSIDLPQYKDWAMYDQWFAMNVWRVMLDEFMGPFPWVASESTDQKGEVAAKSEGAKTMEVANTFMGAMGSGDSETVTSLMHDDMVWKNEGDSRLPWIGPWEGKKAILEEFMPAFGEGFKTLKWEPNDALSSGDTAAYFGTMIGETTKSGEKTKEFTYALRVKVKDGKIILWNWFEDSFEVSRAFNAQ